MRRISYYDDRECPEDIEQEQLEWFKKYTARSFKKIVTELKKHGWKIDPEYDAEVNYTDSWEYGAANHTYFFEFSIKGGQRLIIDRKKIVADGHIDGQFMIIYHSDVYEEHVEAENLVGGWTTPIYEDASYTADCPTDGIKYIEVGDAGYPAKIKNLDKKKWKEGQEKNIAEAITKAIFAYYSRSKWKKRGNMSNLRTAVIKLAHNKPELRKHLLPILKKARRYNIKDEVEYIQEQTQDVYGVYPNRENLNDIHDHHGKKKSVFFFFQLAADNHHENIADIAHDDNAPLLERLYVIEKIQNMNERQLARYLR